MWAIVFDRKEEEPNTYNLSLKNSQYPCQTELDDLSKAVNNELERRGYYAPQFLDIFSGNPFQEDRKAIYATGTATFVSGNQPLDTDEEAPDNAHRIKKNPYYVLVSPLERKQQILMDIVARDSQGT